MRDVRYAFRLIRRQPMFAALVIATLTLGIGASTSMFSVVNGVLLKPLPYGDLDRLVWMYGAFRGSDSAAVSPPDSSIIATATRFSSSWGPWRSARRASRSPDRVRRSGYARRR